MWGPEAESEAAVRLGWVEAATVSQALVPGILELRDALSAEGVTRIVLCGMGGSSLAPEVIAGTAGVELTVLDSTDPEQVAAALADRLTETAVVVSSKSGSTVETDSQRRIFEQAFTDAGVDAKSRIIIVTDPGSPLEQASREAGYRAVFNADPNVGGRFSALTAFGLVPCGLAGVDIQAFLDEAEEAAEILNEDSEDNIGLALGTALGGTNPLRDKIVIAEDGSGIVGFADWAEQLIAESTGKNGTGVLPVVAGPDSPEATLGAADVLVIRLVSEDDRCRTRRKRGRDRRRARRADDGVGIRHSRSRPAARHQPVRPARRRDGQSRRPRTAGRAAGTDPGSFHRRRHRGPWRRLARRRRYVQPMPSAPCSRELGEDSYLSVQAYFDRLAYSGLESVRDQLAAFTRRPVTFGWGPRFLHSTGQFHKGGPAIGVFLQVTAAAATDLAIPDRPFTFSELISAQAAGDAQVLSEHGRPVLRLHLTDRAAGVRQLQDIVASLAGQAASPTES